MLRPSLKFLRRNVVPTSLVDGFFNKTSEACFSKVPITFTFPAWKAVLCLLCAQDQTLNNFENNTMKLSENEAILSGLWASNCATIQQVLILKICLQARKVSGSVEKRAAGLRVYVHSSWDELLLFTITTTIFLLTLFRYEEEEKTWECKKL